MHRDPFILPQTVPFKSASARHCTTSHTLNCLSLAVHANPLLLFRVCLNRPTLLPNSSSYSEEGATQSICQGDWSKPIQFELVLPNLTLLSPRTIGCFHAHGVIYGFLCSLYVRGDGLMTDFKPLLQMLWFSVFLFHLSQTPEVIHEPVGFCVLSI